MSRPKFIEDILASQSIVEYLSSRGLTPAGRSGNRVKYICPFHGPEKAPSFFVINDDVFEHYHCFGCRVHGDLIDIRAALEGKTTKQVIAESIKNLGIKVDNNIDYLADLCKEPLKNTQWDVAEISYKLSQVFYRYLKHTDFDPEEVEFMESVMKNVDTVVQAMDENTLNDIYQYVVDVGLPKRYKLYHRKIEENRALSLKNAARTIK